MWMHPAPYPIAGRVGKSGDTGKIGGMPCPDTFTPENHLRRP